MVGKITSGKSVYGVLAYNQDKVDKKEALLLSHNRMLEPPDGNLTIRSCMQSFEPYLVANRRTEKPVIHISLNPHPDDKLSDEQMIAIAQEYLEKLGYGDQPYIMFKHTDIERNHLHIVSLRVDENGKKINDSWEWKRSEDICRELEKKYDLVPANRIDSAQRGALKKVDYEHGNLKMQISNVVKPVVEQYRFQSLKELRAVLSLYNVTIEETRRTYNDKVLHGIIYAAADDTGKRVGRCINSSKIGKEVGYFALQNKYLKSKEWMSGHFVPDTTKQAISTALKTSAGKEDFLQNLRHRNIDAVMFQNESGRIYGVTFIDHNSKSVFKGSALGKDFSANALHMAFDHSNMESNYHQDESQPFESGGRGKDLVGSVLDMFNMESGGMGEDFQQENEARRLIRKKKKKKQGMHL